MVEPARHNPAWRRFFVPLTVVVALLACATETARELLRYERAALVPWRLIGAHLVHLSWSHAVLNVLGLVLIGALFAGRVAARWWWLCSILGAAAIDSGLFVFSPRVGWYVGLSGVLHGLFVMGAFAEWRDGHKSGLALLAGVALKVLYEQTAGALPMTASAAGGPVVVDAHLYGALGGLVTCGLMRRGGVARPPNSGDVA